jgi:hypothetical protein
MMEDSVMWYLKTKLGTFWIVKSDEESMQKVVLGMDEDALGVYQSIESAVDDVVNHETGALKWDEALRATAPSDLQEWMEGEPESWREQS